MINDFVYDGVFRGSFFSLACFRLLVAFMCIVSVMSVSLVGRVLGKNEFRLAHFCAWFRSWWFDQVELVGGLMRWVVKVVLEWLEEVVDLFLRSSLGNEENASVGNSFDRPTGSLDGDGLVVGLCDPEGSVRNRCDLVAVILFVPSLETEKDFVVLGYNFTLDT